VRTGPGSAITIVVGGATESLAAQPGTADLTLKRRLGFIKLAVKEGADLVPVFSFGENDVREHVKFPPYQAWANVRTDVDFLDVSVTQVFDQLSNKKGTGLHQAQKRFQAALGFTMPIFWGRGIFNCSSLDLSLPFSLLPLSLLTNPSVDTTDTFGLLPYRQRITSVVGRPIKVTKNPKPTLEELEEVQARYIEELGR
jgi:2-acylglycerol O-acyltransferase 2